MDALPERFASTLSDAAGGLPSLLDVPAVARLLNVSERTVERIVASGRLRPIWIEGQRRFTPAAVEAYVKACAKRTGRRRPTSRRGSR